MLYRFSFYAYFRHVPGMMVSCSVDKTVTLWDTNQQTKPQACGSKDMGVGKLYTLNFYPSSPWLLGCAGGGKEIALWDMTREAPIQKRFGHRVNSSGIAPSAEAEINQQQEAFDAMMSNSSSQQQKETQAETPSKSQHKKKNKKKVGSGKKKRAHRAGK
jgi:WD40 repeat protein